MRRSVSFALLGSIAAVGAACSGGGASTAPSASTAATSAQASQAAAAAATSAPASQTAAPTSAPASQATAAEIDRQYIDMMVPHHQSAIEMAKLAQQRPQHPELKSLADEIIKAQEDEISRLTGWRQDWFGSADTPPMSAMPMMPGMAGHDMGGAMTEDMTKDIEALKTADPFDEAFLGEDDRPPRVRDRGERDRAEGVEAAGHPQAGAGDHRRAEAGDRADGHMAQGVVSGRVSLALRTRTRAAEPCQQACSSAQPDLPATGVGRGIAL
jgi:uncharacterized protein (DUF305 family)